MRQTIAIRHVAFEDLGQIDPVLRARGYDIVYQDAWNLDRERVEDADLVVFLGGPISVNDTEEYPFQVQEIALAKFRIGAKNARRWAFAWAPRSSLGRLQAPISYIKQSLKK